MTKEELEKEAVEYAEKINLQNVNISGVVRNHISQAYLASAEPRQKRIAELKQENAELKEESDFYNKERGNYKALYLKEVLKNKKAKEIMNIAVEGIKCWGIVGGTKRPFEKQAENLFNLFLDKAEQFLKNDGCLDVMCEDCTKEDCGIKKLGLVEVKK